MDTESCLQIYQHCLENKYANFRPYLPHNFENLMALPEHEGNQTLDQAAEKGCRVSSLVTIQNFTGPEQPPSSGSNRAGD